MKKNVSRFIAAFLAAAMSTGSLAYLPEGSADILPKVFTANAEDLTEGDFTYVENDSGVTLTKYTGSDEAVTIPATLGGKPVTAIGSDAFYGNDAVKSLKMPETITSIGRNAFKLCSNLSDIKLHEGITSIGSEAFNSVAVTEITIPSTLTSCENQFYNCKALKKVIGRL